jgi:type I restriction-modification system DNA methylase subunit
LTKVISLKKGEKDKLEKILNSYFAEIHRVYVGGNFREESFYSSLKKLVDGCFQFFPLESEAGVLVQPKKTDVGIPDFVVKRNGDIVGYIEAKSPDANLDDAEKSQQLKRYRESLPNLILTNLLEFRLYRNNDLIDKVEVGRQSTLLNLKYPPALEKLDLFFRFLERFFSFSTPEIKTSSSLSIELAKKTRFLEHILQEELSRDNEQVTRFYRAFQEELIETLTKERFADLYAQTITYGLFAARMRVQDGFNKDIAWKFIPESLPLLREIFHSFTGPQLPESLLWVVDDICQVLRKADISSINREFQTTRWEEDPVINFYETFLATYNPEERQRLGVYYTPLPVVSYITTSIHKLLKSKFGKAEGLATNDVTLLDPAAGTLTFVVQAIKQVQKELVERNKAGLIRAYIAEHILPHFHAFEILVAPYTVGHFKVSMVLEEMGYKFKKGERFQFYLTNTLEMKEPKQISFLIDLAKEGQEAKRVKEKVPILVISGNPPYSVSSENKSEFIEGLMDTYKEDVRSERNIQPLSDDYIKFIRLAHWKIEQAGKGILGFITNSSYLSGIIHRGMRKKLLETFDEIHILNLHGSSRIGERAPEGGKDENVFAIQQGVAVALYVKTEEPQKEKKVYYADLWGLRNEKYDYLLTNDVETTRKQDRWQELKPVAPYYFLVPKDFALQEGYEKFWKVTEIFKKWSSGVKTSRDKFVVGFTKHEVVQKVRIFAGPLTDELVKESLRLRDTRDWSFSDARKKAKTEKLEDKITTYAYRAFDNRHICYSFSLIEPGNDRFPLMRSLLRENIAICSTRIISGEHFEHALVSDMIGDYCYISNKTKEVNYFFPLYLYSEQPKGQLFEKEAGELKCAPNFTAEFLHAIKQSLGTEPSPEQIFYYIYAVLYSPAYRQRYEEFLKIDFPRIPLPTDYEAFKALSNLGRELVELHLLKHPALQETEVGFPEGGSYKVDYVRYNEAAQRVRINKDQYFEGITKEVWEYRIGAYQVMEKYLKDRRGRKLSLDEINHYMKVAKAIRLTIGLQRTVDEVYARID